MKTIAIPIKIIKSLCAIPLFFALNAAAHPEEQRVVLEPMVIQVKAGKVIYEFELLDIETGKLLGEKDLNITHEKVLHTLVYDSALKEFQHVHPEFDGKYWKVKLNFSVDGSYWIWAQGELKGDGYEFSAFNNISVSGGQASNPLPPVLGDIRYGILGNSKVTLSKNKLQAGKMAMLDVTFTRTDGSQPQIEPYLGAFAHIVAVASDGDSLLHVHPMNGSKPNQGMIHATFPREGDYRLWIQFIDGGSLKTIPLSVTVTK